MIYHKLIVIGGGASGLMAAITAKDFGADVAIVEGTDRVGKKILTTGNGRCNISNSSIKTPYINYHSLNKDFFVPALSEFGFLETKNFFYSLGLPLVELENNKIYPQSLQASSVVDIFRLALMDRNIPVYNNFKVKNISTSKTGFKLSTGDDSIEPICCEKLIIACGGKSAVKTGSDGSGYTLCKSLSHTITETVPAIVQLKLDSKNLKSLSGIKFNGYASINVDGIEKRKEFGEILFTDYGISGPPILQLSRIASVMKSKSNNITINLDLMPDLSENEVSEFLENHFGAFSYREVIDSLIGIFNKKLIPILLKEAGITNLHKPCYELTWKEKKSLLSLIKNWSFKCIDSNGFNNAQVTAGGINTHEVSNYTLESKLVNNLYFCGEILDVDGDCGGFNLQWAWSSGYVAGKSAATKS